MTDDRVFVIVGAGMTGAKAAEALRTEGFDGRVLLIGEEPERPYERPPLSKEYVRGEAGREKVWVHDEDFYASHSIELRLGAAVTGVSPADGEVTLAGGEKVRYDRLLLAPGASPRQLPVPGAELDGVLYLRNLGDSDALRERLDRGGRLVVVGAGWIGSEIAASARQRGLDVTVLDTAAVPLERVLGSEVGAIYGGIHAEHGVRVAPHSTVEAFEGKGRVERVRLGDGSRLECDFVVVGIGAVPRTELALDAGLAVGDGILADALLETSAPGIYAAGDAACAHHPFYGERLRVEHWANALNQGPAAARSMLGSRDVYTRLPYFFSDQYDVGMEYSGYARTWERVVLRGDPASREFIAFWLTGERVVAGMNVNVWDVAETIQRLIRERVPVDDAALADPAVALEELAAGKDSPNSVAK